MAYDVPTHWRYHKYLVFFSSFFYTSLTLGEEVLGFIIFGFCFNKTEIIFNLLFGNLS